MKKVLCILSVLLIAGNNIVLYSSGYLLSTYTIVDPFDDIKSLFEEEQYQEIIDRYSATPRILSPEELTYVAHAYLMLDKTEEADKYIEMAIKKNPEYSKTYYVKGLINTANKDFVQASKSIQQAITLDPDQAKYYTQLGDIYYAQEDYMKSLELYKKAISFPVYCEKAYYMIGAVHSSLDDLKNALDAFYIAKSKVEKNDELYVIILYNIGNLEYDNTDYNKAVEAYQELLEYFPDDYYSIEKIVQCYNALGYYEQADIAKKELYAEYEKGNLSSSSLSDMFSIDYFTVDDKSILVYERYEDLTCRQFNKNIIYISDQAGNIESELYLEYIPPLEEDTLGYYRFRLEKENKGYLYNVRFEDYPKYSTLRPHIIDIAEGKQEPVLSTE